MDREAIGRQLQQAREARLWTQRELAAKASVTQAQVSKLEQGKVDARLSTLSEVARLLGLEIALVPQRSLPAIAVLAEEAEAKAIVHEVKAASTRLENAALGLDLSPVIVERLVRLARDLAPIAPLFRTREARAELADIVERLEALETRAAPLNRGRVERAIERLAKLRAGLVHANSGAQRPAYSLDED